MGSASAARILHPRDDAKALEQRIKEYDDAFNNPFQAAKDGFIDDIIAPRDSRKRICRELNRLMNSNNKQPTMSGKKHGCGPI
jgi:propionyl-CoA carboxylase beta chain